jgi:hypothetical protein
MMCKNFKYCMLVFSFVIAIDTNFGKIIIEKEENTSPSKGDMVYTEENTKAPDAKYKLGFMHHITVENGRIINSFSYGFPHCEK